MNDNTYPIYVISKGRADCCLSSMCLQKNNVKHVVVVEPQELDEYKKHMPDAEYIVTPFSNLNQKAFRYATLSGTTVSQMETCATGALTTIFASGAISMGTKELRLIR